MRASTIFVAVAALAGPAFAATSTVAVPVQQISDGQVQNPATPLPPAPSSAAPLSSAPAPLSSAPAPPSSASSVASPPPAPPSVASSAAPPPVVATPPAPSGGGIPPAYGNITQTASKSKTITATVIKPTGPSSASSAAPASSPASSSSAPAPSASKPAPSASRPAVQTGAANTLVGSTIGLGFAAFLAALLG